MKNIALHLLDVCRNSFEAKATEVNINIEDSINSKLIFTIQDNGKGMDEKTLQQCEDPFYTTRTTRKVGLGIPLLKQNCLLCHGGFNIKSKLGKGTILEFYFIKNHIDCLPLGDISGVITSLLCNDENVNTVFQFKGKQHDFQISTEEIKTILDNIPINSPKVYKIIKGIINENIRIDNNNV